jgi:anti-sigma-K factor RskA
MTHEELQELLGAYALDAVEPDEAAQLEAHLAECPSCQAEVAAHRETAAKLGNAAETPPQLWDRIAANLSTDLSTDLSGGRSPAHSTPDHITPLVRRRPQTWPVAAVALAAAAIVVIVLLGVSTLHLQHRVNALNASVHQGGLQQAAAAAVLNPDHTIVHLVSADGRLNAQVVALPDGQAYLLSSNLPAISADRTYQLWGLVEGSPVSLGLLGAHPELVAFRIDPAVVRLMVTAEPQGGRPAPDGPVLIQGPV